MSEVTIDRELLADLLSNDREKSIHAERTLYAILANPTQQSEAVEVVAYMTCAARMTMDGWENGDEYAVIASEASDADKRYNVPLMTVAQHQRILAASVPAGTVAVSDGCVLVPEARETGSWESARIGDFNAGWNACRESVFTLLKKAAYMELDTVKRSIAIQDELRALLASAEGVKDE